MQIDLPAECPPIDHIDQDQRRQQPRRHRSQQSRQSHESRLRLDQARRSHRRHPERTQYGQLPRALQLPCQERTDQPDRRHAGRQPIQHTRDDERLIEDPHRNRPDVDIGAHQQSLPAVRRRTQPRDHCGGLHARLQKNTQRRDRAITPKLPVDRQAHQHIAAIVAVGPENARDRKAVVPGSSRQRQRATHLQSQPPCEWLGDEDCARGKRGPRSGRGASDKLRRGVARLGQLHRIHGQRA